MIECFSVVKFDYLSILTYEIGLKLLPMKLGAVQQTSNESDSCLVKC